MQEKSQIQSLRIQFYQNETLTLDLFISNGGSVNRRGDGSTEGWDSGLAMGHLDPVFFAELMEAFEDEWLNMTGRYEMPEISGDRCQLSIELSGEKSGTGIAFIYGTESMGPPEEIIHWVDLAVSSTDEWYHSRKRQKNRK